MKNKPTVRQSANSPAVVSDYLRVSERQIRRELRRSGQQHSRRRALRALLIFALVALAFGAAAAQLELTLVTLRGDGMAPGLAGGDVVLCRRVPSTLSPELETPRRGSLVTLKYREEGRACQILRRVIAVGGDEVFVTMAGQVTVNGEALDEPYATLRIIDPEDDPGSGLLPNPFAPDAPRQESDEAVNEMVFPITVPKGKVFVLADDRETAADSRSRAFGLVDETSLTGQAWAVIWPVYRAKWIPSAGTDG